MVAGLFALHPLQTQAVSYVVQRAEVLASLGYLGALWLLLLAERRGPGWRGALAYGGALLALALGLGSKAILVDAGQHLLQHLAVAGADGREGEDDLLLDAAQAERLDEAVHLLVGHGGLRRAQGTRMGWRRLRPPRRGSGEWRGDGADGSPSTISTVTRRGKRS